MLFPNHYQGQLVGKVRIVAESRHDQLITKMKQGPVIGIHFPNSLQGFSVHADREQMSTLPPVRRSPKGEGGEGFILSGMDTPIAMVMYPDILAQVCDAPSLDLSAFSWQSPDRSLRFETTGSRLDFRSDGSLDGAYDDCSGGLLFLR